MLSFSLEDLTVKQQKKLLIGSVIPRPTALVSTQNKDGVVNLAPFSYFNIVTYQPPVLGVAVQRVNGSMKDTAINIVNGQEAVVHIVDRENVELANQAAVNYPPERSELDLAKFELVNSSQINVPGLLPSKMRFETSLFKHVIIQDEEEITADLLLLKVVYFHVAEEIYQETYIDPKKLDPVARLAGSDYSYIGEVFALERPEFKGEMK
ncbi:flavin reductase family protein [Facklamia sp. DSM 111018]|uniref:Flavin reductase family protein n=1 Tax=Facklamia lactis TaxID=2749967 RepID=A0ABS0LR35_9LACT|nr:flavin reductase family protein [Facklamia lactis]MBG9981014.1 flavin reductase family protein [Facklamia lactis]MBG9986623.1 flavin reductase family protein [Facklamia lactis]